MCQLYRKNILRGLETMGQTLSVADDGKIARILGRPAWGEAFGNTYQTVIDTHKGILCH